jgi:uncharacterized protein YukE
MARKGFAERMMETGVRVVAQAAEAVMKDPRGQDAVARAIGLAQRGRKRLEETQERLMRAAGIPGRQEYQDLAKQLARLKRKARELADKLDAGAEEETDADRTGGPRGNGRSEH